IDIGHAAIDGAPAGDHAVAGNAVLLGAEIAGAVFDEHVELLETAGIEQDLNTFAGGKFAAGVLGLDARFAAAGPRRRPPFLKLSQDIFHGRRLWGRITSVNP